MSAGDLTVRLFDVRGDYQDACEWWREHGWTPCPADHLSPTGLIVFDQCHKYCAGWLYVTSSGFAWFEFLVSNPQSPIKKRKRALELIVEHVLEVARGCGVKTVFTSLKNKNLEKLYQQKGFVVTDRGVTHLIARVS